MTSLNGAKARGRKIFYYGRSVYSFSNNDGLIGSSLLIRLVTCNRGEARFLYGNFRGRRRDASEHAAHKHMEDRKTLKKAVAELMDRVNQGISVSSYAYTDVLKWCANERDLESVKQVHESVKDSQIEQHPFVESMLLKCYIECGRLETAEETFNKLLKKSTVIWNMMISGHVKHNQAEGAIEIYKKMRNEGGQPDTLTYMSILKACASPMALKCGKEIHAHVIRDGFQEDVRVGSSLVQMYSKCGSVEDAKAVFRSLSRRNVVCWNVMIGGLAEHGLGHEAFSLFLEMQREGFKPDAITYLNILKPCSSSGALEWVKEVHAHATRADSRVDVRVENALMQMYGKSGSIEDARAVFGKMSRRDVVSWNVMIGELAEHGLGHEAFSLFLEMQREGFTPNTITYLNILKPCSSSGALKWVKEVHAHATRADPGVEVRVESAIIQMYGRCGSIEDARAVFDKMRRRDVVSWNVMIGELSEHGLGQEAFSLFLKMQSEGFTPDAITYLSILNPRSSSGALEWVKEVHAYAMKANPGVDVRVESALVQMYCRCGSIEDARAVFDKMRRRDLVSWNVMIGELSEQGLGHEAFSLFLQMQSEGFTPDAITYLSILNPRSSSGALEWVKEVHATRARFDVDVRVDNALVQMYGKSGSIEDAKAVFGKMGRRDIGSWNVMIRELAEHGLGHEAFSLLLQMQSEGFTPDAITYLSILNPRSSSGALDWVKEAHAHATRTGLDNDVRVERAFVQMYAKSGSIDDAKAVFDKMKRRDIITWNMMIGELADHGLGHEAFSLFLQMQSERVTPDAITYLCILNPCSSSGGAEWVKKVHAHAVESGLDVDLKVGNAFVQMYSKTGLIGDAKRVFEKMPIRDVVSCVVMISGLAQHGQGREALQLFEKMKSEGVKPNEALFAVVLSACSHSGLVEEGRLVFDSMRRDYGIEPVLEHYTCMVDALGRAGRLKEAELFILNMPIKPTFVTWSALLGACRIHKDLEMAEVAARECLKLNPTEASPYVVLSNVYAVVGKWDQVTLIRSMMKEKGIRKEPGRSWIEVANKVHQFQAEDTSHPETREIYIMLSNLSEKLKAEGYIPDTRLVLRNIAEEEKEGAVCYHSEKLAIAYGLIHVPPGEPIRLYKNLRICSDCHAATKLISRFTGRDIIARDASRFHHFKNGSCSCDDYW